MGHNEWTTVTLAIFHRNPVLVQLSNDKIFEMLSDNGIQYLDQSSFSQLTQKISFQARAIDLILAKIIQPYVSWFTLWEFFEILLHDRAQYRKTK